MLIVEKRGTTETCRRIDEARLIAGPSVDGDFKPVAFPSPDPHRTGDEAISLLKTLVDRVEKLEASLHGAQKRVGADDYHVRSIDCGSRAVKIPKRSPYISPSLQSQDRIAAQNGPYSPSDDSQTAVEQAATVLEFLAWGEYVLDSKTCTE